jgi:hypothetical protein
MMSQAAWDAHIDAVRQAHGLPPKPRTKEGERREWDEHVAKVRAAATTGKLR